MGMFGWVLLFLITIVMGAIVGFGFTIRRVYFVWYHMAAITLCTFIISMLALYMGQMFTSIRVLEVLVGFGLIGLGILLIRTKPNYPGSKDLLILSFALQLVVILLSFRYVQTHDPGFGFAFMLSLLLGGSIASGMVLGQKRSSNWRIVLLLPYLPSICFILIGVITVF